jgi:hypothetical protein
MLIVQHESTMDAKDTYRRHEANKASKITISVQSFRHTALTQPTQCQRIAANAICTRIRMLTVSLSLAWPRELSPQASLREGRISLPQG